MTTILMASDDDIILDSEERESLCHFSFNHWQNLPQTNKWCKILAEGMRMCAEYFGSQDPLVGSFSGRSFSSFIDACAQEYRLEHELPVHIGNHGLSHPSSEGCSVELFPAYFRGSSGASLAYTVPIFKVSRDEEVPLCVWITAIPDIMKFINFVNDLLSCPKEILTGEAWNYMTLQTQVKRQAGRLTKYSSKHNKLWTFRDTVCEMLEELQRTTLALDHAFTKCIRTGIDDCPIGTNDMSSSTQDWKNKIDQNIESAAHLWMSFKYGYISLHLNSSRYGLEPIAFGG
ncbi:uncharacterized protein N7479_002498 [Penicillium vulpinum]|uniref:Uncharacterized protein n=1 Tax=Penicillium vulpinum TaxID=29845 RepID=A0A1V6RH90_9EURO|nr:uncharacterized protein N7479_002498 [Penicillium vulpinum]KAJ5972580.1 hypothetical protein N7479_002498 [Penicillium vulpinum]OQE01187.1 hypothetical protein PENVUL_c044G01059 [Penicillium vulpinum]